MLGGSGAEAVVGGELNRLGLAILILGLDLRVRQFTPEAATLLNLELTDVGRPLIEIKSNLLDIDLHSLVQGALEQRAVQELTVTDLAGRWHQLTVRPLCGPGQALDGAVVTLVNLERLQRSQLLHSEAREHAERILDTVREPLLILDETRRVRSANHSFCKMFEVGREEVEEKRVDELGDAKWVQPELSAAIAGLATGQVEEMLVEPLTQFGDRAVLIAGRPLARPGRHPWIVLSFEDITAQMKAEAAVRRSERALREMLGAAPESIFIADGDGLITYANATAGRTFRSALPELVGRSIEEFLPGVRQFRTGSPPAMAEGPAQELLGRRQDGTAFPAQVGLSSMEGEHGPLLVAFISDVTARKEADARIRAYKDKLQEMAFDAAVAEERQRRRLAADLHDNIGQALALAQIRLKAVQPAVEGSPARDLGAGIKLIAQALSDSRELTFELSPPVLYDLGLPAAVGWLADQFESQHHLKVTVEAAAPFPKLSEETAGLLFRSLRELLTNVVKHARCSTASVSLHQEGSELSIVVEDHGVGLAPERLKNQEASAGFGLFSVREQMARLGGTFEAVSRRAQGTTIVLRVPLGASRSARDGEGVFT